MQSYTYSEPVHFARLINVARMEGNAVQLVKDNNTRRYLKAKETQTKDKNICLPADHRVSRPLADQRQKKQSQNSGPVSKKKKMGNSIAEQIISPI